VWSKLTRDLEIWTVLILVYLPLACANSFDTERLDMVQHVRGLRPVQEARWQDLPAFRWPDCILEVPQRRSTAADNIRWRDPKYVCILPCCKRTVAAPSSLATSQLTALIQIFSRLQQTLPRLPSRLSLRNLPLPCQRTTPSPSPRRLLAMTSKQSQAPCERG
jgi:hypothetical protein